jgi:hypothetical protein
MKKLISNYTFDKTAKTVTFVDYSAANPIKLENVLLVTNVTVNQIIYNFADPAFGGVVADNVLTLAFNTSTMTNSDKLQIFYDDAVAPASDTSIQAMTDVALTLKRIAKNMESLQVVDTSQRQRVVIEGASIPNMGTLSTLSNVALIANVDPRFQMIDLARTAYNSGIRANLTF